ncbi:MAG: YfhO family protein, partial [Chloroflexi bacterium]|nr:YfhO family protein [Chloroflexota bacterium]
MLPLDVVMQLWAPWRQPNQPVITHNEMLMDAVNYIYPAKEFMAESVRNGDIPLWNPYEFTGYPFTYNTQAGVFYPLSLFYYLLPAATAVDLLIIVQMSLGAGFMFLYLRRIKLQRMAALIGASVFILNGLMAGWLEWQVVHAAIIWLPAQLYLVERIADKLSNETARQRFSAIISETIILGIFVAIPWLGGHWSWTLYSSMTLGLYMAARFNILRAGWLFITRKNAAVKQLRLPIMASITSLSIGVAISLVQLLPAFNYLNKTHRDAISISESMRQGLFSRGIVSLIPNFFGNPIHDNWWGPTYSNFIETTFYTGILTLLLSCLVLFMRRDFHTLFFSVWGGVTLLWTLGSPAYLVLYALPVFNGIQPSRAAFLVTFSLSILAALAVDKLMRPKIDRPQLLSKTTLTASSVLLFIGIAYFLYYRVEALQTWNYLQPNVARFGVFFLGAIALLLARIRSYIKPHLFGWLALTWIMADLFLFGINFNTVSDVADLYPETPASAFLKNDSELYRITAPARGWAFLPNTSLVMRIPNLSGYEPGVLQRITNLLGMAEGGDIVRFDRVVLPLNSIDSPILDMLNVKYLTTMNDYWVDAPEIDTAQEIIERWSALPVEQTFTMNQAGLQRIDVPLQLSGSPEGTIVARILSKDGVYEFAHSEINVNSIKAGEWNSFFFEPFPSTWGRTFRLRIEFTGNSRQVEVGAGKEGEAAYRAYYLPRPELAYEDGKTRIYLNEGYFPRAFIV